MITFRAAACGDVGKTRQKNDDFFCIGPWVEQSGGLGLEFEASSRFFCDYGLLCAVADGMGGYEGGSLAAKTVLETLSALFYAQKRGGMSADSLATELEADLEKVQRVLEATLRRAGATEAGTTLAGAVFLPSQQTVLFHCGDSRILRASGGYIRGLTVDHSPLAAQVASGQLDEAGAIASRLATKLSRSIGLLGDSRVEINTEHTWEVDDLFLFCSDGFHGLGRGLPLPQIRELLCENAPVSRSTASEWVAAANECDGSDNATLIQIEIVES